MLVAEREALVLASLALVKHVAHRVASRLPSTVEMNDLYGAGVLGLLDAVEKFQPERGVKFNTYAEVRIRGAILDSLRNLDWAPRSLRKKHRDLERVYGDLEQQLGRAAEDQEVCAALGETLESFHELVDQLNGLTIGSFESMPAGDNNEVVIEYYAEDDSTDPYSRLESSEMVRLLSKAIDSLPEKERLVVSLYYFEELTMKEIGSLLGVNESRVSQLHSKATLRLRGKLKGVEPKLGSAMELMSR